MAYPCDPPKEVTLIRVNSEEDRKTVENFVDTSIQTQLSNIRWLRGPTTDFKGKLFWGAVGFIHQARIYCKNTGGVPIYITIGFRSIVPNNNDSTEEISYSGILVPVGQDGWLTVNIQKFWVNEIIFVYLKGLPTVNFELGYTTILTRYDAYTSADTGATFTPEDREYGFELIYTGRGVNGSMPVSGVVSTAEIIKPPTVISNVAGRVALNVPYVWRLFHQITNYSFMKGCVFNRNLYIGTFTALPAASIFRFNGNEFTNVFTDPNTCQRIDSLIVYNDLIFENAYDPIDQTTVYSSPTGNLGSWVLELTPPAPHILMPLTPAKHNNLLFAATQTRLYYRDTAGAWDFVDLSGFFGNIRCMVSWNGYLYIGGALTGGGGGGTRIIRSQDGLTNWETVYNNPLGVWMYAMEIFQNKLWAIDNMLNNDYVINSESGVLGSWNQVFDSKHPTVRCYKIIAVRGFLYNLTYNGIAPAGNCRVFKSDGQAFVEDYSSPPMSIYDLVEYNDLMLGLGNQIYLNEIRNISSEPKIFNATAPDSVLVTNVATLIPFTASGVNFNRATIVIQPLDGDIYWGYTNLVTAVNGHLLEMGDTLTIKNYVGPVYCIRAGGADVDVRYSEFYE